MGCRLSSRERMLRAIRYEPVDYVPCSFMALGALKQWSVEQRHFVQRQLALGLDPFVFLPFEPPGRITDWMDLRGLPERSGVWSAHW